MARYAASFASVRNHLMRGDAYLLNLCVATPVETNLTLRHLFRFARAPYRMLLGPDARVPGVHGRSCVCFSPEPFVTVRGRSISTFPMKGTPLLELEKFEYRARLANAQAGLEQARLDVSTEPVSYTHLVRQGIGLVQIVQGEGDGRPGVRIVFDQGEGLSLIHIYPTLK